MNIEDITVMEQIIAKYKYRYEILDSVFGNSILGVTVYAPINITGILNDLKLFQTELTNTSDFEIHCVIGIMNLFAHYKHYYIVRKVLNVIIVGYVRDKQIYNQFKYIISNIQSICDFFPHIYFMENITNLRHTILVGSFIRYLYTITIKQNKNSIHVYSNYNIDKQLLTIFPTKDAYKINKQMYSNKVEFLSKEQFIEKLVKGNNAIINYRSEIERLCVPIGLFLNTYICISSRDKNEFNINFQKMQTKHKIQYIIDFIEKYYRKEDNKNINSQFIEYLSHINIVNNYTAFTQYEKEYDTFIHQGKQVHIFMQQLYNAWKAKLKDYSLSKESEKYKMFTEHHLYVNWLL
jgi:hypothetical protein